MDTQHQAMNMSMDHSNSQSQMMGAVDPPMTSAPVHHQLSPEDPDNPMNWPIYKRVYVSLAAAAFTFAVAFGATGYTVGITGLVKQFNVSMTVAILGYSLYFWGIFFAPIFTPHLSERFGRTPVYLVSIPLFSAFVVGAGASNNFASVAVCRFFAGFCGGPNLVLIEGTFADVWSPKTTVSYYAFLTLASYIGTAAGPLILGFVVAAETWRWTQWVTLMLALAAFLFGLGMPETYGREILRQRAKRNGVPHNLPKALSGVTIGEMAQVTIVDPLKMAVAEPLVMALALYVSFNFGVIFQFFITIPVVLSSVYGFTIQHVGLAFNAAIVGSLLAAATAILLEYLTNLYSLKRSHSGMADIEYRLVPAMLGGIFITASLFWIGFTAKPSIDWASPVIGTLLYVWGNMMVLVSIISYIFDAYPPRGTLAALTTAACGRLLFAGVFPLFIIQMFTNLQGKWALGTFGFINAALIPIPFILFKYGPTLRMRSKYGPGMMQMDMKPKDPEMATSQRS